MTMPTFSMPHLIGIDVSHWDNSIDWSEVAGAKCGPSDEAISFVILKATEGLTGIDPTFGHHWPIVKLRGFMRGAYHFFKPGISGEAQANHFLSYVKFVKGDIRPILDIETPPNSDPAGFLREVEAAILTIKNKIGIYPFVYSYIPFFNEYLATSHVVQACPDWMAEYNSSYKGQNPRKPLIWQFSDAAIVPGVALPGVDMNVFYGTEADLEAQTLK